MTLMLCTSVFERLRSVWPYAWFGACNTPHVSCDHLISGHDVSSFLTRFQKLKLELIADMNQLYFYTTASLSLTGAIDWMPQCLWGTKTAAAISVRPEWVQAGKLREEWVGIKCLPSTEDVLPLLMCFHDLSSCSAPSCLWKGSAKALFSICSHWEDWEFFFFDVIFQQLFIRLLQSTWL